jgi:hypothetical protein
VPWTPARYTVLPIDAASAARAPLAASNNAEAIAGTTRILS